ncbi:MAG: hypothetical protein ACK5TK_05745 [Betaproteobacteria bacterium]
MKVDLIADCARLADRLDTLATSHPNLGVKAQESLYRLASASRAMLHLMRQVSENYIDLTAYEAGENRWTAARAWWNALPDGRLTAGQVAELVKERSATLARLYRASLDFPAIAKISESEVAFAREIGDEFRVYKTVWSRLKKLAADGRPYRLQGEGQARAVVALFSMLLRHDVVASCEAQLGRGDEARSIALADVVGELRRAPLAERDRLHLRYEIDGRRRGQLTGGWFEAYAYHVFQNMLERFSVDFEIFSRVQYEASLAAKSVSRGEIDLLVGLSEQIFLVECKSAELSTDEAQRVVQKARFLRDVLQSTGVKEAVFILVTVPPESDESQSALDRVAAEGIEVMEPQDIRTFLSRRLAGERSIDRHAG